MDIKEIIAWALKRWYWFAISVFVCLLLGGVYYLCKLPVYAVEATLMLRQTNQESSNQEEMIKMMGFGGNKITGDEVKILTSRDLMGNVVDQLGLTTYYWRKEKMRWLPEYPVHTLTVRFAEPVLETTAVMVKVHNGTYHIHVNQGMFHSEKYCLSSLEQPIRTIAGEMRLSFASDCKDGKYKAVVAPRVVTIDRQLEKIEVSRLNRESNIITLTSQTTCPERAIETINTLLDLYNLSAAADKNRLALQTEQFLADRIAVVTTQLNRAEADLEEYKRTHHIADLDKTAEEYQKTGDYYEQQVAEMDAEQRVLDFVMDQISKPENAFAMIPGNLGMSDATLQALIQDYNMHIIRYNTLLQTATVTNPVVVREADLLEQKRLSIASGIEQARQTLELHRQHVLGQQNQYDNRLASIPEQERRYLEMQREKTTKEEQYVFLIEKREENALLLASDAVPAKIIDRAQLNPNKLAPKLKMVGLVSLLLGLCIPLCFYFLGLFRKEYLS